jgi:acetyl-CoA carboxylase biotin carboxyl carrier protein
MNIKEVKDLIHEVLRSDISEFELEHTGTRVRLKRELGGESMGLSAQQAPPAAGIRSPQQPAVFQASLQSIAEPENPMEKELHVITSPIVGTFYRAPSPGAEAYVKIGDQIEEGSILCLIEAMKLMNEIPSDIEGEVVQIYVDNGHPVEFGQKLFGIRPQKQG